jgi:hypothetical protein
MIRYALACEGGHTFESWFPDSANYEKQLRRGLVACAQCGSTRIEKAIMAPSVVGGRAGTAVAVEAEPFPDGRKMRAALTQLRREIEARTDDVGEKFPEVARAMHLGDAEERPIRGRASLEQAKSLIDEGIGVLPMPTAADELN